MSLCLSSVSSVPSVVNIFATEDTEKIQIGTPAEHEVHVWKVSLDQSSRRTSRAIDILSPDERQRACRFHFAKDRNQFIQSRAALRRLLAGYLRIAPAEVRFSYSEYEKPALANGSAQNKLHFNLSRRDGLALIAVAYNREVGIDLELIRPDLPLMEIAESSFSSAEIAILKSQPETTRTRSFYNCWTRKEAYLKARGEGLSFPLKQFDVSLAPGAPARLLEVRGDSAEVDSWMLREIPVNIKYVAALAIECHPSVGSKTQRV